MPDGSAPELDGTNHPGYIDLRRAEDDSLYYCVCTTGNNAILATSETYPTREHLDRAVETFQRILAVHLYVRDSIPRS